MRLLAVSIYVYSAISKFDYQFTHGLGVEFLETLTGLVGINSEHWDPKITMWLALAFPAYELLMGIGLLIPKSRQIAAVGIIVMHLSLILILGPLGMGHQPGVLLWNAFLIGQTLFLFLQFGPDEATAITSERNTVRSATVPTLASGLMVFVLVFPCTVGVNLCDHWPGWEVYAPRSSRAKLEIGFREAVQLPIELQALLTPNDGEGGLQSFAIDRWSIETLNVPIYPEDRFQFAVAAEVVQRFGLRDFKISIGGISNRWSGEREWKRIHRPDQIQMTYDRFRLNGRPRRTGF